MKEKLSSARVIGQDALKNMTQRSPQIYGRTELLVQFTEALLKRGENWFIYLVGLGGYGKARILEEMDRIVQEHGAGYLSGHIFDLYHSDVHSNSDVERALVDVLDPGKRYFDRYRLERLEYEMLRERGCYPAKLEKNREALSSTFVREFNEMSQDAKKIVLFFDTIELLQYESSVVEEKLGIQDIDTRIRSWLLTKLPRLKNVLVVFAGRPKESIEDETTNHQKRLEQDMRLAFGDRLALTVLPPLSPEAAWTLIQNLTGMTTHFNQEDVAIIHLLTGGRPIMIHLLADLLHIHASGIDAVRELLNRHRPLLDRDPGEPAIEQARRELEDLILTALMNDTGTLGETLKVLRLMPKGFDADLLHNALGFPIDDAESLVQSLQQLSFVKSFLPPPGGQRLHEGRLFLHDEMYRLLNNPDQYRTSHLQEVHLASSLVKDYYDPQIRAAHERLASLTPDERLDDRERLQKLKVERLYYLLVNDPVAGYREFGRLTAEANRERRVGFSMRLLDEFLRFYNNLSRRKRLEAKGISHEQLVRESVQRWIERFHWWALYPQEIDAVDRILINPGDFFIDPQENRDVLGNIIALWARAKTMIDGYNREVTKRALDMLKEMQTLPPTNDYQENEILARGRLATTVGYGYRHGGLLQEAEIYNIQAIAALSKLATYKDELAMVLNNQALVYGRQGKVVMARIRGDEALVINKQIESEYSTGLTLTNLATIERVAGDLDQALRYAIRAEDLFHKMEDAHGVIRAYDNKADAMRRMAKRMIEEGRDLDEARLKLDNAAEIYMQAIDEAVKNEFTNELRELRMNFGKVNRELGRLMLLTEPGLGEAQVYFQKSLDDLQKALEDEKSPINKADILQDIAWLRFLWGYNAEAEKRLDEINTMVGYRFLLRPGRDVTESALPTQYYWPLGKAERLRGEIYITSDRYFEGLQRFLFAYAYFYRFSENAVEKDQLISTVYKRITKLPEDEQHNLVEALLRWGQENSDCIGGVNIHTFLKPLTQLLNMNV